ncbi:MAG: hydrogenase maturation protease [Bacteroidales bacterium]|nr:hydrogenase maturation protease [Bacteroidales bacterium]
MNNKILIYGYGNPGRRDDGLGIAFADEMGKWAKKFFPGSIDTETNYQLNIEDAELISHYDAVVFVDASLENMNSFALTPIEPSPDTLEFTMHAVSPGYVIHLCHDLFQKKPKAYLMHIKGYEWNMQEGLTEQASINLKNALSQLKNALLNNYIVVGKNHIFDISKN